MKQRYINILLCLLLVGRAVSIKAQSNSTDSTLSKAAIAQQRAIHYINHSSSLRSQNLLMILQYLHRAYSVQTTVKVEKLLHSPPIYDDEKAQMKFFGKLYGVHTVITKNEIEQQQGLIKMMAWSINADVMKPNQNLSNDLWAYSKNQDRNLTHAALCLAWIREQSATHAIKNVDSLAKLQVQNLTALADREDYTSDTGLEALVGLIRLGYSSLIKPEWINKISASQLLDGGWAIMKEEAPKADDHTTILALWVLADYQKQGQTTVKWIQ